MEFSIGDPKNIIGMSSLMSDDTTRNITELEKEIINGINIKDEEENDAKQFKKDMERMAKTYDLGYGGGDVDFSAKSPDGFIFGDETGNYNFDNISSTNIPEDNNSYKISTDLGGEVLGGGNLSSGNSGGGNIRWPTQTVEDNQLRYMTLEQKKQNYVDDVLHDMNNDNDLEFDIDKEKEADDKNSLLEQIDMLRTTLEEDSIDLSNIPQVNKDNSLSDIQNVCRILRLKNDRNRYCSFAEELILSGAYGMEYLFDGHKEWFGRKPDLVGWSQTVKVKLRRMRYTTSTFVQDIMQEYNLSSGMRLMLELLPSMFLYSRQKKLANDSVHVNGSRYDEAISNLNSQMS